MVLVAISVNVMSILHEKWVDGAPGWMGLNDHLDTPMNLFCKSFMLSISPCLELNLAMSSNAYQVHDSRNTERGTRADHRRSGSRLPSLKVYSKLSHPTYKPCFLYH